MKRIILNVALLFSFFGYAQNRNTLLSGDFWKTKPNLESVKSEISKGNHPAEANEVNIDVVCFAINNNAPIEVIKFLIDQKGNGVDKKTHDGRNYLHWAANKGNLVLVKYLINKGASINMKDEKGATPLNFAAFNGMTNPEVYEVFFQSGINPKATNRDGATVLHLAIAGDKDLKLTEYLIGKGLSLKDTDELGRTTFDYAARSGDVKLLKALLNRGVKATDQALIFAARGTRMSSAPIETYRYLIGELGINPNAVGENNETALHYLIRKKNHQEIVNYFLSKNVDINKTDKSGNNVFMSAVGGGDLSIVESLLPLVKDINQANNKGETALHLAVQSDSPEIVSFLIHHNADLIAVSENGNLAFSLLQAYKKHRFGNSIEDIKEKLKILESKGVSLSSSNQNGMTLYHIAVTKNDLPLLKLLENKGIDINKQDREGMTPLHRAASMSKNDTILKYLLSQGANKHLKTELDETAYDLAKENEYLKVNHIDIEFLK